MTLRDQLVRDEGNVDHLYYDDRGIPTIGIGTNLLVRVPDALARQITITPDAKEALFTMRVASARDALFATLPWMRDLDDVRVEAFINIVFNMGIDNLVKKNAGALAAAQAGDWPRVKRELLGKSWERQVGARARRIAEQLVTGIRQ